jgi:hypothetical protein
VSHAGRIVGNMTRRNVCSRVAPKLAAAYSMPDSISSIAG